MNVASARRGQSIGAALALLVLALAVAPSSSADSVISDFDSEPPGSYDPRAGWDAFGVGTTDAGVTSDGSAGAGAYHTVDWSTSTWGVGDVSTTVIDLSAFSAIEIDARVVDLGGHSGTARLRFALDLPAGVEWSTPSVSLNSAYQTYTFDFGDLALTAGSGPLDLSAGRPKFIFEKNGQAGSARCDFDRIVGVSSGSGGYQLSPVELNPPPDGDAVRGVWLYAFSNNLRVDDSGESQAILDFCAQEGINRIYFGAYNVWTDSGQLPDNLRTFLRTAHQSGIRVEALVDGVGEFQNPNVVENWIDDILALHNATPGDPGDNFDAIHFDVEFWLSSAWNAAAGESERQILAREYLDNVPALARSYLDANGAPEIGIGLDLSAHFDTSGMLPSAFLYDGASQFFVQHALDHVDDVVLMSYIDSEGGLLTWTAAELDMAVASGRTIQLAVDIQPVPPEVPINSFADNFTPTPFAAMTSALEGFHSLLTNDRLAALDGFTVFHYDGVHGQAPIPRNIADLTGDGEATGADFTLFASYLTGPGVTPPGVARDADFDGSGAVDLADFVRFSTCYTGPGCGCPVPNDCKR